MSRRFSWWFVNSCASCCSNLLLHHPVVKRSKSKRRQRFKREIRLVCIFFFFVVVVVYLFFFFQHFLMAYLSKMNAAVKSERCVVLLCACMGFHLLGNCFQTIDFVLNCFTWSDNSFKHRLNCNNGSAKPNPPSLALISQPGSEPQYCFIIRANKQAAVFLSCWIITMMYLDVLRIHPEIWHHRTKVCSVDKGRCLSPSRPLLKGWIEMVLICRASQSSSPEHQVMTTMHLSIASSTFSWECAFYCSAVMMYINRQGVSTFRLSA